MAKLPRHPHAGLAPAQTGLNGGRLAMTTLLLYRHVLPQRQGVVRLTGITWTTPKPVACSSQGENALEKTGRIREVRIIRGQGQHVQSQHLPMVRTRR